MQLTLFWLANNMHLWVDALVMVLFGVIVGALNLVAALIGHG